MHKAPIVEERLKRTAKVGDIVRFEDPHVWLNWQNGATGIVTGVLLLCGLRLRRHRGARVRLRLGRLQI